MQWVFGCCESDLEDYYWRYSFYELRKRLELTVGHATAVQLAHYTTLVEVASAALGGGNADKGKVEDIRELPSEVYQARVSQLLSGG